MAGTAPRRRKVPFHNPPQLKLVPRLPCHFLLPPCGIIPAAPRPLPVPTARYEKLLHTRVEFPVTRNLTPASTHTITHTITRTHQ